MKGVRSQGGHCPPNIAASAVGVRRFPPLALQTNHTASFDNKTFLSKFRQNFGEKYYYPAQNSDLYHRGYRYHPMSPRLFMASIET
jgi:hypothetical protein